MIKKIYFDMDGVLADFDKGIRELCGLEPIDQMTKKKGDDDLMWERVKELCFFRQWKFPLSSASPWLIWVP